MKKQKIIITTLKDISHKIETEISDKMKKISFEEILYLFIHNMEKELLLTRVTITGFISLVIKEKKGNSDTRYVDCKIASSFKQQIKTTDKQSYNSHDMDYYMNINNNARKEIDKLNWNIKNSETFSFEQFLFIEKQKSINPREINELNIYNIFLKYTKRDKEIAYLIKNFNFMLEKKSIVQKIINAEQNIVINILKIIVSEIKNLLLDGWIIELNIGTFEIKYHNGIDNYYLSFLNNQNFRNFINH